MIFIVALSIRDVRRSLLEIIKTACRWNMLILVGLMLTYTSVMVCILYVTNFWNVSLLKDTILWFFFTATVFVVRFMISSHEENVFYSIAADSTKIVIVFEVLVNTYTFSLPAEFVLVFFITLVTLIGAVADMHEGYKPIARVMTNILVIVGLSLLIYSTIQAVSQYSDWWTINTVRKILLAPLLSILFSPFVYMLLVYSEYERIFTRLSLGYSKPRSLKRYAKRRLIAYLGVDIGRIREFSRSNALNLMWIQKRADVDELLDSL